MSAGEQRWENCSKRRFDEGGDGDTEPPKTNKINGSAETVCFADFRWKKALPPFVLAPAPAADCLNSLLIKSCV